MSIEIRRLGFSYGSTDVLHDITFTAADGDIAAVLGPNGVGKSTLFRCVLGFLAPSEGGILVNGKDPADMEIEYAKELTKKYMADRAAAAGITIPEGYEPIA